VRWRSEVVLAVTLFGSVAPSVAGAQAPAAACACFVGGKTPGTVTPPVVPGVPGVVPPPETPGSLPVGSDGTKGTGSRAPWAFLGATGLVLLSGVPFGGGGVQGPLFGVLPVSPGTLEGPQVAAAPTAPIERAGVTELPPSSSERATSALPAVGGGEGSASAGSAIALPPTTGRGGRAGRVPPKTATHLPLVGALGVLMTGAGLLLLRRSSKQQRRRRRRLIIA